jgi:hypothetical protein
VHLRPGIIERAAATGICAAGLGMAVLLGGWGVSFLWRYTPREMVVRIANPDLRVIQNGPLTVTQDKPFVLDDPKPLKIDPVRIPPAIPNGAETNARTPTGQVIGREVTVFSTVKHGPGNVVTGWIYKDGGGDLPINQYWYYSASNLDGSITKVDIAANRTRGPEFSASLVPDLDAALAKCQWWEG